MIGLLAVFPVNVYQFKIKANSRSYDYFMRAVITAAGRSSRLRPLTNNLPKGLLAVGQSTMLRRSVEALSASGHDEIIVVVGFQRAKLMEHLGPSVKYVHNPFYETTNNLASLWFALSRFGSREMTYLHSDLVYSKTLLERFLNRKMGTDAALSIDYSPVDDEAMKVKVDDGRFIESSKDIALHKAAGEWIGLAYFSDRGARELHKNMDILLAEKQFQEYDTAAFNRMAKLGSNFSLISTENEPWHEVDTPEDLDDARQRFGGPEIT